MSALVITPQLDHAFPDFGDDMVRRLEVLIEAHGGTPTSFARQAGLSLQTLQHNRRLASRSMISMGSFASICVSHDVSPTWWMFGKGERSLAAAIQPCPVCVPQLRTPA